MQPNPASQHKPPSKPLCADLWPTRHTGQHRPTSAHQTDAVGHLWRSVKAVIQKSPPPKHSKNRGEKKKQEKALALSLRQGGHFHPQCGRLRETEVDAFLRSQNGN